MNLEAKSGVRRKLHPIEVTYLPGAVNGPSKVKVCVQAQETLGGQALELGINREITIHITPQ